MRKNRIVIFFQLVTIIVILGILGVISIALVELFEIADIPEKYSVLKYIPATVEVSIKEYDQGNLVSDTVKKDTNIKNVLQKNQNKNYSTNRVEKIEGLDKLQSNNKKDEKQENVNRYYYSLLDEYGKIIYDGFLKNVEELKTGTYKIEYKDSFNDLLKRENGTEVLEKAFQKSLNAFIYDNPEVFYLDISKMYLHTEVKKILSKKISNVYISAKEGENYLNNAFDSKYDVDKAIEKVREIAKEIKLEISDKSKYAQIKYIHDYLVDNLEYDRSLSRENIYNIYGALVNKLTVCEGYAKAFKYLADELGIETIFVIGVGINREGEQEAHSWNYVKLEKNWYAVDATWDDPIIQGGYLTKEYKYRYFLKGSNDLRKDHKEDGKILDGVEFVYPKLNVDNYQ